MGNNIRIKTVLVVFLIVSLIIASQSDLLAQCPMCRMSAENNLKQGGTAGKGLNAAILFLLATPYVIVGTLGFIYWKYRKKDATTGQSARQ